jgi:hypothetical protein
VTAWEYTRIRAFAEGQYDGFDVAGSQGKVLDEAQQRWIEQLNLYGAEGWELVSERFATESHGRVWAEYTGTMKRAG